MFRRAGKIFVVALCMIGMACGADDLAEVRRHLDSDGDYYEINRTTETHKRVAEFFHELKSGIAALELPEEQRVFLYGALEIGEAMIDFSGLREIAATGKSSKRIADKVFYNRSFYLVNQPATGVLWNVFPAQNNPLLETIGDMPAETSGALVLDLDFTQESLQREVKKFIPPVLTTMVKDAGIDAQKLAHSLSGRWQILIFLQNSLLCILPDHEKEAFNLLKRLLEDEFEVRDNDTMIKNGLVIGYNSECLVIAKNFAGFDDNYPTIKDTEIFKRITATIPGDGVAAYFSSVAREPETLNVFGIPVNLAVTENHQLGILRREEKGFSLQALSDMTIPCENAMATLNLVSRVLAFLGDAAAADECAEVENQHRECQQNLLAISAALKQYREKHGSFPTGVQADGWKALLAENPDLVSVLVCPDSLQAREDKIISSENCSYIYFGDWGELADGTMPLVIDVPVNHTDSFNVLYSDGSVATLEQENVSAVRKAASLLHTVNRYNEARFIELMRRAEQIDQLLKLE